MVVMSRTKRLPTPQKLLTPQEAETYRYSWVVLIATFILRVFVFGQLYSLGVLYIHWLDEFQRSRGETAWVASIATGTTLMMGPFSTIIYDRFSLRLVIITSAFISSFGILFSYFAQSIMFLTISLGLVSGVAGGIVNFGAVLALEKYFYNNRPLAMGIGSAGTGIGGMIFGMLQEFLIDKYSWRDSMLIMGAIQLNMIVCGALIIEPTEENLRKTHIKRTNEPLVEDDDEELCYPQIETGVFIDDSEDSLKKIDDDDDDVDDKMMTENNDDRQFTRKRSIVTSASYGEVLRNPIFLCLFACDFLSWMVQYVPYVHIPERANKLGYENNAFLVSTMGLSSATGKAFFGILCTYIRKRAFDVYTSTQFLFALTVLISPFCVKIWSLTLFSAAFGFFSGNYCLMMIIPSDLLGENYFSIAYGILLAGEGIGVYLGPPLIGWLSEVWNSYGASLLAAGIILLSSALSMLPIYCIKSRRVTRVVTIKHNNREDDDVC